MNAITITDAALATTHAASTLSTTTLAYSRIAALTRPGASAGAAPLDTQPRHGTTQPLTAWLRVGRASSSIGIGGLVDVG